VERRPAGRGTAGRPSAVSARTGSPAAWSSGTTDSRSLPDSCTPSSGSGSWGVRSS